MKKKFLGLICLLYALIIIYVIVCNYLKNFLAPNMQLYLKISVFVLIFIWFVVVILNKVNFKFKISDLLLLLPLLMIILAGDGKLNASIASNRSSNISIEQKEEKVEEKDPIEEKQEEVVEKKKEEIVELTNIDFDIKDESYIDLANFFTYNKKSVTYEGKTIRVRGYAVTDLDYLPEGYFAIGKFGVSCCTADASFTGFVVKYNDKKIENNGWYEIEGYLERLTDLAGFDILSIKIVNIKEIDGNQEEYYVYPCYSYDDGKCEEIRKYNIKF